MFDRYWNSEAAWPVSALLPAPSSLAVEQVRAHWARNRSQPKAMRYLEAVRQLPLLAQMMDGTLALEWVRAEVLADAPELRHTVGQEIEVHGGGLLFSSWDLAEPSTSRAFALARERAGSRTKRLLELLERAGGSEPYRTPDILAEAFALPPEEHKPAASSSAQAPEGWDLSRVIDRLRSEFGEGGVSRRYHSASSAA